MMTCNRTLSLLLAGGMALSAVPAVAKDYILAPALVASKLYDYPPLHPKK